MTKLNTDEQAEFEKWFCENTEIPDGVEVFETFETAPGCEDYVWEETRNGLARWTDIKCSKALIEAGVTQITRFSKPLYWVLGEDGKTPVSTSDIMVWAACMGNEVTKRVALDHDGEGKVSVSTVFLGIDHAFGGGPPVLFETMVFGGQYSESQMRYHTWDEALEGHNHACERLGIKRQLETWIDGEKADD